MYSFRLPNGLFSINRSSTFEQLIISDKYISDYSIIFLGLLILLQHEQNKRIACYTEAGCICEIIRPCNITSQNSNF